MSSILVSKSIDRQTYKTSIYLNKLTIRVITLLPLSTLLQAQPGFGAINQLIIALSFLCFVLSALITSYPIYYWLIMMLTVSLTVFDVAITKGSFTNINLVIYLLFWVLSFSMFSAKMDALRILIAEDLKWIQAVVVIWCILVSVSIPLPGSYYVVKGQGFFFCSFAGDSFRLSPTALLVLTLIIVCLKQDFRNRWIYGILSFVPLFCAFMGYSRTYLGVILLMYVLFLWEFSKTKKRFYALVIAASVVAVFVISISSISSKIDSTSHGGYLGFWDTLTSGRSSFWAHDMQRYSEFNVINILFGGGFNKIYEINREIGINIWAHNDFINLLVTNGIVGLIVYLIPLVFLIRKSYINRIRTPAYIYFLLVTQWLINAFFNMEYTYVCAAIATAFAFLLLTFPDNKELTRS